MKTKKLISLLSICLLLGMTLVLSGCFLDYNKTTPENEGFLPSNGSAQDSDRTNPDTSNDVPDGSIDSQTNQGFDLDAEIDALDGLNNVDISDLNESNLSDSQLGL